MSYIVRDSEETIFLVYQISHCQMNAFQFPLQNPILHKGLLYDYDSIIGHIIGLLYPII